ncbi:hypothetical protein EMIHUDRAFT_210347 [Emiliania huxleyi CCMP1516]|uniref:Uncharacterized protein n=2 Tax=Emiliania huxleyi TaxID=2903 RepID=A0A0D3IZV8_EMIH1|nr:hypothetical protein EMIHUDRAFT_210347 [Emiliania huxleyi CCMP1516]EOD16793.1 hypothetical protein EMIHUDRAFT_210347 [Emiliania huxleyi CCMP1516]|eukprot:XP_005769222.1 hypothetical protein EMIHUDRAFT_210347 [Emiliania huxleyi CCMP1516]
MAPTQLSIVLERLLNELGVADLSTFEAVLMHDTGAVLDAIRSTAAAAEAGAAAYASSATSNVVVSPGSTATAGVISELEEKLRSQTKELASEQRSASAVKRALASARDEHAAAQELRRSHCDNLRRAQQAAKRDIKAAERMADEAKHAARAECEWRIGEMRAKMQEQLVARQISMEAEARRADGLIIALAEAQRKREHSDC